MKLFNVYPRYDINITKALGSKVLDNNGTEYIDLYGGHGVISIGHSHPTYVKKVSEQLQDIGFYSNSIDMPIQEQLAQKLGELSGYNDYELFLINSGAEAIENALKLASFHTQKKKFIAFKGSFHGRSAGALNVTDNSKLSAPMNAGNYPVVFVDMNDKEAVSKELAKGDVAAVIVEGIQGVGGLDYPSDEYLQFLREVTSENHALLILDEIQSGYGRSGNFFAHQSSGIKADIITIAKGMGNGFPIGGVLISPSIEASFGLLGTTFGGNHLACAASLAVLEVVEKEELIKNAQELGAYAQKAFATIMGVKQVKGKGLMLGVEFDFPIKEIRSKLLFEKHIFTGASANANLLRILPPLSISKIEIDAFVNALNEIL